ncbi:MAG: adenosylmethionine--8-amino-7-oxononanoate transaminase [Bacteroidota bacterium]|jgi:adenosylmethionine---8-amino-7-oxononanoate aminotransferase|nr:adenosylmethionine--8-amino-7-oxononanoate transaminase [Bacteroidota bacterium]
MDLQKKDEKYIWHPYTHQKNRLPAIPIVRGEKSTLIDENGNQYIDAVSSWWVNIHGHGNKFIAKKIYEQAKKLQQVIFTGFTHAPAVELAEKLLKVLPGNFSKIFYSDNGSTATEVALKIAIQYWSNVGDLKRNKILAFHNSYHGDTFGAMSVSERGIYTFAFQDKLFEVIFIDTPTGENLGQLKDEIEKYKNEIACIIYEPLLQGAGGMLMYQPEDLNELLHFLKEEKIICIADEVLTGFYRVGKFFAGNYMKEKSDIICLSKALTGGTMALGVTACTQEIYDAFVSDDKTKTLFHGHSFTANPLACTAALASLELIKKDKCLKSIENIMLHHQKFHKQLLTFKENNIIKNIRKTGTIIAFEICTSEKDDYLNNISNSFTPFCMKRGVYLRSMGNTIYIMPPYCITSKELKKIYGVILEFLEGG